MTTRAAIIFFSCWTFVSSQEQIPEVVFLTQSSGFVHEVVRRPKDGGAALAEAILTRELAGRFRVTCTQRCGDLTKEKLRTTSAVVFYTTGELPMSAEERGVLFEWIRDGGAFVGIHSASDTWYKVSEFGELIGGYFDGHPWHQEVSVLVKNSHHPATRHLGDRFVLKDEIYQFRDFKADRMHVVMTLDPASVDIAKGKNNAYGQPLAWCHSPGKGRVFYTALGHRPDVWTDPRFVRHVEGALAWATRQPTPPPEEARVLFGGEDLDAWTHSDGRAPTWRVHDGTMEVVPKSGGLETREKFQDFTLHLEFSLPTSAAKGQARSNSGVYLQGRYEVQILDSYGQEALIDGCGSLYRRVAPSVNACDPPETWQTYDITFRSARFDAEGKKTENARVTVVQNGRVIHDDVALEGKTGAGRSESGEPGPIQLQDHGDRIRFRNIWIQSPKADR